MFISSLQLSCSHASRRLVSTCARVVLTLVQEYVLVYPALHVGLSSACVYIPPFPPTSGPGNMPAPQGLCLIITSLLWFRTFAFEDALTVLPEYVCGHVFRLGLTPYDTMYHFWSSVRHFFWSSVPRLSSPIWPGWSSRPFEKGRCSDC
jgi:hypothetical protein